MILQIYLLQKLILKDEKLDFGKVEIEKTVEENLTVYRVFYGKTNTPYWMESFLSVKKTRKQKQKL